jgi:hypothetical protein
MGYFPRSVQHPTQQPVAGTFSGYIDHPSAGEEDPEDYSVYVTFLVLPLSNLSPAIEHIDHSFPSPLEHPPSL